MLNPFSFGMWNCDLNNVKKTKKHSQVKLLVENVIIYIFNGENSVKTFEVLRSVKICNENKKK